MEELNGTLDRIIYQNAENGWAVGVLKNEVNDANVTIVGNLVTATPGELLKLHGEWINNKRFGRQFKVERYEATVPTTEKGLIKFLSSGLIKGIGPQMAERIVNRFGTESMQVIETDTDRLCEVEGIGKMRLEQIKGAWDRLAGTRNIMIFLQSQNIGPITAQKIYKRYGKNAIKIVSENPYQMAYDISNVGFKMCDAIAKSVGIGEYDEKRIEAGVYFNLQTLSQEGHVCIEKDRLVVETSKMLSVETSLVSGFVDKVVEGDHMHLVSEEYDGRSMLYLKSLHISETGVAKMLLGFIRGPLLFTDTKKADCETSEFIKMYEEQNSMELSEEQKHAIDLCAENNITIITGGPGTGKTTITKALLEYYKYCRQKVLLAAPTGRAARRMAELTGEDASTIHRLLEYTPRDGGFKKDIRSPLEGDVLIVDEFSMVDVVLCYHLLKACPPAMKIVFVGDVDQLPSVGPGSLLRDMIISGTIPTVRLEKIFRQAKKSLIVTNAHKINKGEYPYYDRNPDPERLMDFYFLERKEPEDALGSIIEMCTRRIPDRFGFDAISDIQVLTPMYKGILGVQNLNKILQEKLNRNMVKIDRLGREYRLGDKVMQLRNNYDLDVFNGDSGRITGINHEDQELVVEFDGTRKVKYDFSDLDDLVLSYAASVHKSQGSEYKAVVMPIHTQHFIMLQRNLLYTAITRAKKLVVLVGSFKALAMAIKNDKIAERSSLLLERLREGP